DTSTAVVTINIVNVNEVPTFQHVTYTANINENSVNGVDIISVPATDVDSGDTLTYTITGTGVSSFSVLSTGVIEVAGSLDLETKATYTLSIKATDAGGLYDTATVTISINDVNENPVFSSAPYSASVAENNVAASVVTVTAADPDAVKVIDNKGGVASTSLTITVTNSNDSPTFLGSPYTTTVDENLVSATSVLTVSATDQDSSDNLTYSLTGSNHFSIASSSGLINTAQTLDYETLSSYSLTVTVSDGTTTTTSAITITVNNNNDVPVFTNAPYTAVVDENSAGSAVYTVSATDADSDSLQYFISGAGSEDFVLNPTTGVVTLSQALNYERKPYYFLTIFVLDGSSRVSTNLNVTVNNTNDAPSFVNAPYTTQIVENRVTGSNVYKVTGSDEDTSDTLTYSMSGTNNGHFAIGSSTGVMTTAQVLDYESVNSYSLTVKVSDGTTSVSTPLTISVTDANDSPVFTAAPYNTSVNENDASATVYTVSATDQDTGRLSVSLYRLQYDVYDHRVSIDENTGAGSYFNISSAGVLTLAKSLDYESSEMFPLTIAVTDNGVATKSSQVSADVAVAPVNEHTPVFTNSGSYSVSLSEDSSAGTEVLRVTANDADKASHGIVSYSIVSGNDGSFYITASTGAIYLIKPLDRESSGSHTLLVQASDGTNTANATVILTISDVNDNYPVCSPTSYAATIREDAVVGSSVVRVTCTDDDEGINELLVYSITSGNTNTDFTIDANGTINTLRVLDYETTSYYTLTIKSRDSSSPSNTQKHVTVEVSIAVTSVNEHTPVFTSSSYAHSIQEDTAIGTSLLRVTATDDDKGPQGEISYSMLPLSAPFYIDVTTGIIHLKSNLDRESTVSHSLSITAHDNDPITADRKSANVTVALSVTDVNDNKPVFSPNHYKVTLDENTTIGTNLTQVQCTDRDLSTNAALVYSIVEGDPSNYFNVSSNGQIATVKQLDYETVTSYSLTVQARDSSSPISSQLVGESHLDIIVSGVNEYVPIFSQSEYNLTISENTAIGASLFDLDATDADQGTQGHLSYTLSSSSPFFIDQITGLITLNKRLDYESTTSYKLVATATDGDTVSPKSSRVNVTIYVRDENDNKPTFTPTVYSVTVAENTTVGKAILSLTCADADSGTNGQFNMAIISGNTNTGFSINDAGIVTIATSLDMETTQTYSLVVIATDQNVISPLTSNAQVTITITDINEHTPTFNSGGSYTVSILENATIGFLVANVTAADNDFSTTCGSVIYTITSGNDEDKFYIRPLDGTVFVKQSLDRELTSTYTLQILATDQDTVSPKSSTASLLITLSDVNDNIPVCEPLIYSKSLAESVAIGTTVTQVTCSDKDTSVNGIVSYNITSGNSTIFRVSSSGLVTTKGLLDYESDTSYVLVITVIDGGETVQLSSEVTISVEVTGINEFAPSFGQQLYSVSYLEIPENTTVHSTMVELHCSDVDMDVNIAYNITAGNTNSDFTINASTGVISLVNSLDGETTVYYDLVVLVSDQGTPQLTSEVKISIAVQAVNEFTPTFANNGFYNVTLNEDVAMGTTVLTVSAHDSDSDRQGDVSFAIISGNDAGMFELGVTTGAIVLKKALDYELHSFYSLVIRASDGANLVKYSDATVNITIVDLNDSPPVCRERYKLTALLESTVTGTVVFKSNCTDSDSHNNALLSYHLTKGNEEGKFNVTSSGDVILINSLNSEQTSVYNLVVMVADAGSPSLSCNITLTINIQPVNEFVPTFAEGNLYDLYVLENITLGTVIFQAKVQDNDTDLDGSLTYVQVDNALEDTFYLDAVDGRLILMSSLDREKVDHYNFTIKVHDGSALNTKQSNVTLHINVVDVNDNEPVCVSTLYSLEIPERTSVYDVNATDDDKGIHGNLEYYITSGLNGGIDFTIDKKTGVVRVGAKLDRETRDTYIMNITAKDRGTNENKRLSMIVVLTIGITDENDNPPVFTKDIYTSTIPENIVIANSVAMVTTTDTDIGINAEHTFKITGGDGVGKFSINESTGIVSALAGLDYETKSTYYLSITARDQGVPQLHALAGVRIFLSDVNDNKPVFSPTLYITSISETTSAGSDIIPVHATDPDTGVNAEIVYSVAGGDPKDQFDISSNGTIRTKRTLDREDIEFYTLVICASDKGSPALNESVSVNITILDVNDNAPIFASSAYSVAVPEDAPIGIRFLTISAADADRELNAKITYSIVSGNVGNKIAVEENTGDLYSIGTFDREDLASYQLTIKAQDTGSPFKYSTTNVQVRIIDRNDNTPSFTDTDYSFVVTENQNIGLSIGVVKATDSDNGTHAQLVYSIEPTSHSNHFTINPLDGSMYTASSLDRESVAFYRLKVRVSDSAIYPHRLYNTTIVSISVLDMNDNPPEFSNIFDNASIAENSPSGTLVTRVTATDSDHDANARISYTLSHASVANDYFRIDAITGEIFVRNALDYERTHDVIVTVTAKDAGLPSLAGSMKLRIDLIDLNDNVPVIESTFYEAEIRSDRTFGPPAILTLNGTDKDSGNNGKLTYELENQQEYFMLDPDTGAITLKATPSNGKMFTFRVRAKDNAATPLTSAYATIRIDTIDAEQTMVDITLDITQEEFEANKEYFLKKLSEMLGAEVKIADIQEQEAKTKRKRREAKRGIKITLYAVINSPTNTTDVQTKVDQVKRYLSRDDILSVLLDKNGNLSPELTNSTELNGFKITKVTATKPTIPPKPSFMEKIEGIVTVSFGALAIVVIFITIVCFRSKLKKR
ncbi:hypothetical protein QZH41_016882, partial [Actinostola sp. cb2023]